MWRALHGAAAAAHRRQGRARARSRRWSCSSTGTSTSSSRHGRRGRTPSTSSGRVSELSPEVTAAGGPRRVLEVAAAEAVHSCKLNLRGIETFVVEPSPFMLERARAAHDGVRRRRSSSSAASPRRCRFAITRSIASCSTRRSITSGEPERGIREMTRVLRPDGRLVISFVNYESLSVRLSRRLYASRGGSAWRRRTATCSGTRRCRSSTRSSARYPLLRQLCAPVPASSISAFGVSIGWMVPDGRRF